MMLQMGLAKKVRREKLKIGSEKAGDFRCIQLLEDFHAFTAQGNRTKQLPSLQAAQPQS